jgi:hypothetical protein
MGVETTETKYEEIDWSDDEADEAEDKQPDVASIGTIDAAVLKDVSEKLAISASVVEAVALKNLSETPTTVVPAFDEVALKEVSETLTAIAPTVEAVLEPPVEEKASTSPVKESHEAAAGEVVASVETSVKASPKQGNFQLKGNIEDDFETLSQDSLGDALKPLKEVQIAPKPQKQVNIQRHLHPSDADSAGIGLG